MEFSSKYIRKLQVMNIAHNVQELVNRTDFSALGHVALLKNLTASKRKDLQGAMEKNFKKYIKFCSSFTYFLSAAMW